MVRGTERAWVWEARRVPGKARYRPGDDPLVYQACLLLAPTGLHPHRYSWPVGGTIHDGGLPVIDTHPAADAPASRRLTKSIGPFLLLTIEIGVCTTNSGRFLGRIASRSQTGERLWLRVCILGIRVFWGCWMLT
jgi:hypothetical protein